MCMQPKEVGPCSDYTPRYYFDSRYGICMKFEYGGCGQNDNNFETLNECQSTCSYLIEMTQQAVTPHFNNEGYFLRLKF